ncbi:hypothetical protein [Altericista sp. CCNU0014]|uniref:hypothetical protein n=1 Tax=Altericista sp. CCNU0014 TaxID=3082949 RepID=UPI00384B596D
MARFSPYSLELQITRLFKDGQSFFAASKVEQWLMERGENPQNYTITFNKEAAPAGSELPFLIKTELKRKDGQAVEDWLVKQLQENA